MFSAIDRTFVTGNQQDQVKKYACLSTDSKPTTGITNGSSVIEMDTGKSYMFDEENGEWEELPSTGGGGGGGDTDMMITKITFDSDLGTMTLGSTWQDIDTAMRAGKICFAYVDPDETTVLAWMVTEVFSEAAEDYYRVTITGLGQARELTTDSPSGYPYVNID